MKQIKQIVRVADVVYPTNQIFEVFEESSLFIILINPNFLKNH